MENEHFGQIVETQHCLVYSKVIAKAHKKDQITLRGYQTIIFGTIHLAPDFSITSDSYGFQMKFFRRIQ